jgi:hypothetical protein
VHLVASLVKRHAQLDYYLDEFTFRFNRRHARHRGLLFYRLLEGALAAYPPTRRLPVNRRMISARGKSGERSG